MPDHPKATANLTARRELNDLIDDLAESKGAKINYDYAKMAENLDPYAEV